MEYVCERKLRDIACALSVWKSSNISDNWNVWRHRIRDSRVWIRLSCFCNFYHNCWDNSVESFRLWNMALQRKYKKRYEKKKKKRIYEYTWLVVIINVVNCEAAVYRLINPKNLATLVFEWIKIVFRYHLYR